MNNRFWCFQDYYIIQLNMLRKSNKTRKKTLKIQSVEDKAFLSSRYCNGQGKSKICWVCSLNRHLTNSWRTAWKGSNGHERAPKLYWLIQGKRCWHGLWLKEEKTNHKRNKKKKNNRITKGKIDIPMSRPLESIFFLLRSYKWRWH